LGKIARAILDTILKQKAELKMKKILIILAIAAGSVFIVFLLINYLNRLHEDAQEAYLEKHYIFDKNFRTEKTKTTSLKSRYLSRGMVTAETIDLFRSLEQKFAEKSLNQLNEHFDKVHQYLYAQFKEEDAQKLFEIYRKYLECRIEITNSRKYRLTSANPKHMLSLLYAAHNFRRDKLGKENADTLFGREVKESEYSLRREIIVGNITLYGQEKESRLQKLKSDMWDGEVISMGEGDNPYNRYQLKLQLYLKDLSELSEKARTLKIEEFRKEFFSPEQIKRLHEVDNQIAEEKNKLERYRAPEKEILLEAKDMTQEEKDRRIKALQDQFFGKDAEAFRRREAIYEGPQK
jgi:lipase chaperone LimK